MTTRTAHVKATGPAGTRGAYQRGCRCSACATTGRAEAAAYMRDYRAGRRGTNAHPQPWRTSATFNA